MFQLSVQNSKASLWGPNSRRKAGNTKWVETEDTPTNSKDDLALFTVGCASTSPIRVELQLDNKADSMEVDTGAAVSIISGAVFTSQFPQKHLSPAAITLKTYTREPMKVLREVEVSVQYDQQPPQQLLLGHNWLHHLKLNWYHIRAASMRTILFQRFWRTSSLMGWERSSLLKLN